MITTGRILVLTYDDIVEGLLNQAVLRIPERCTELMVRRDDVRRLNEALGLADPEGEPKPAKKRRTKGTR